MELTISRRDDEAGGSTTTLVVSGFVDMGTRQALVDAGLEALSQERSLTLDLSAVEFMDSTGIGALIELAKACERQEQAFVISAASPRVHRVLEVTGLADAWSPA